MLLAQRRGATHGLNRWLLPSLAGAIAFVLLCANLEFDSRPLGRFLFYVAFALALAMVMVSGVALSSLLFVEERRQKTLGLLFLTGLKPSEIILGKSLGVLAIMLSQVFGLVPFLALSVTMGGISDGVFWAALHTIFSLHALTLALHLATSTICTDHTTADSLADWAFGFLALWPWVLHFVLPLFGSSLPNFFFCLSPGYSPWLLFNSSRNSYLYEIQLSNWFSLLYTVVSLLLAAFFLRRAWKQETEGEIINPAGPKVWKSFQQFLSPARSWLELNPYAWLAARNPAPVAIAWVLLAGTLLLWCIGVTLWPRAWLLPAYFWITCFVLSTLIGFTLSYQYSNQIACDRAAGTLELLLTTPLFPADIVHGSEIASKRLAKPIWTALFLVYVAFFIIGLFSRDYSLTALLSYLLIWAILLAMVPLWQGNKYHVSFWVALNLGSFARVLFQNSWIGVFIWIQALWISGWVGSMAARPTGGTAELIVASIMLLAIAFIIPEFRKKQARFREAALRDFRLIASNPIPASGDPRLKQWKNFSEPLFKEEPPPEPAP